MPILIPLEKITRYISGVISDAGEINKETGGISSTTYSFKNKAGKVFYLRIPVLEIEKYEAEVYVHNLLQSQGVKVPRVVFFDKFSRELGRPAMIVAALAGEAVLNLNSEHQKQEILFKAGIDLAKINKNKINKFGWIKWDSGRDNLTGSFTTYEYFLLENFDKSGPGNLAKKLKIIRDEGFINNDEAERITQLIKQGLQLIQYSQAYLSHGDFAPQHVYHDNGVYTGIIDFGDISGASEVYDLAHFRMTYEDDFHYLLAGYQTQTKLPRDLEVRLKYEGLIWLVRKIAWRIFDKINKRNNDKLALRLKKLKDYLN